MPTRTLRFLDLFSERPALAGAALAKEEPDLHVEIESQGLETHLRLEAREMGRLDRAEAWLKKELGPLFYGSGDETFPEATVGALRAARQRVVFAESLSAGLAASLLAEAPGASEVLLGAAVTYADRLKEAWLGVPSTLLSAHGPVSEAVAAAMAEGALRLAGAELAVSLTGWAGPDPGPDGQPAGTVFLGVATHQQATRVEHQFFHGNRNEVRWRAAYRALDLLRRHALALSEEA